MQKVSFLKELYFSDKPQITLMYESSVSKEIRICMGKGNIMKEHKAPGAISIMLLKGKLVLGSQGDEISMEEGEMVSFEPQVPHSLEAIRITSYNVCYTKLLRFIIRISPLHRGDFCRGWEVIDHCIQ